MSTHIYLFLFLLTTSLTTLAHAESARGIDTSSYYYTSSIEVKDFATSTLVEIQKVREAPFILVSSDGKPVEAATKHTQIVTLPAYVQKCVSFFCSFAPELLDNNKQTSSEFFLAQGKDAKGEIKIAYATPITTSRIYFVSAPGSYLPESFSLYADGKLIVENAKIRDTKFPEITASSFQIKFPYVKAFRFTEVGVGYTQNTDNRLRFVYEPGANYTVYSGGYGAMMDIDSSRADLFAPERKAVPINIGEKTVITVQKAPDSESGSVRGTDENCRGGGNAGQIEGGKGDPCENVENGSIEKYKWVQWTLLIIAFSVVLTVTHTAHKKRRKNDDC